MAWHMVHPRERSMCSEKNVSSAVVERCVLQMSVRPSWLVALFKPSVFLMISCLVVLSICGVFYNTTKQFSSSQWMLTGCPANLTQFWHYQPGVGVRSHMFRAHFHKSAPTPAPSSEASCKPVLLTNWLYVRGSNIYVLASAAAAKLLQSCPTLCDSIDGSPPGFPVPGILQARTLE